MEPLGRTSFLRSQDGKSKKLSSRDSQGWEIPDVPSGTISPGTQSHNHKEQKKRKRPMREHRAFESARFGAFPYRVSEAFRRSVYFVEPVSVSRSTAASLAPRHSELAFIDRCTASLATRPSSLRCLKTIRRNFGLQCQILAIHKPSTRNWTYSQKFTALCTN